MGIPFNEDELTIVREDERMGGKMPVFNSPVSLKLNWISTIRDRKPLWLLAPTGFSEIIPECVPDFKARGFLASPEDMKNDDIKGGFDMFGVEWVYVPSVGGSMEKPGVHFFDDVNDWRDYVVFPDLDAMDWEGAAEHALKYVNQDNYLFTPIFSGFWFERLLSFMGFEDAAVAFVDEEQEDALHELFSELTDFGCKLIDKMCEYLPVDGFMVHDDWGSQKAPFFSFDAGHDLIVPYMKKLVDHIHNHGKVAELHSCGANTMQIENFIEAGWDLWYPMVAINDTVELYKQYGDKIVIGVRPTAMPTEPFANDDEARECARKIVDELCTKPGYVCVLERGIAPFMHGAFAEEIYKCSREAYAKWSD